MKVIQYPKYKPERNKKYLAWLRTKKCLKCGASGFVQTHHETKKGHGTMGGKCSDKRAVPLHPFCHEHAAGSRHETSREEFWGDIDIEAKILEYNKEWKELNKMC